eukprot:CAMPEP_0176487176 /NCGR_PEP_ID=MMETSP0200_2-20121128/5978_1 /TAXON_ID=947934 /ORGANISM="Chaetoceros sp., Strain GSL56" /LENGTH=1177 /DNA_ID=CAMNT_0017883959 /DNA_START=279 /DNA_END=3812 /DNA_ORIENTATION=+
MTSRNRNSTSSSSSPSSSSPRDPQPQRPRRNKAPPSRRSSFDNLPTEQGKIHTLLDQYGFIYCANRPCDLFFHYSQCMGISSSDELNCGDEVEFFVGPRDLTRQQQQRGGGGGDRDKEDGLSAYQVRVLEKGSVEWEVEDEPKGRRRVGKVEKVIRWGAERGRDGKGGGGAAMVGTIRLCGFKNAIERGNAVDGEQQQQGQSQEQNDVESNVETEMDAPLAEGSDESTKDKDKSGDRKRTLVRFTPNDYGGYRYKSRTSILERNDLVEFTLVTEKRSGIKYARNITLIKSERERLEEEREQKMLDSATLECGTIVSLKKGFGFLKSNKRREEIYFHFSRVQYPSEQEHDNCVGTLEEGQDMEFLVVEEGSKLAARNLKLLPRGSVEFEQVIAKGVTGVLKLMPRFSNSTSSNTRRGGKNVQDGQFGKIRLDRPIQFIPKNTNSDKEMVISEVSIHPDDCKGFFKDEKTAALWVRAGDTLRFDVKRDSVDGLCRIAPTKINAAGSEENDNPGIRIVSLGLAGRAEGIVASIKNDYGFIELAHRNVDVYFRLSEVMPQSIQQDIVPTGAEENQYNLSVGSEVTFDLSLLPPRNRFGKSNGHNSKRSAEKDQLRAQRLIILPSGTVSLTKVDTDVVGFVTRMKGGHSGQIRLNKKVKAMAQKQHYPLIMKLIEDFSSDPSENDLHFLDVQSEFENDIISEIVERRSGMSMTFSPVSDFGDSNRGRISIKKLVTSKQEFDSEEVVSVKSVADENYNETLEGEGEDVIKPNNDTESDAEADNTKDEGIEQDTEYETMKHDVEFTSKKRVRKGIKSVQIVTFDKQSLSPSFVEDPPMAGDKVSMTITYSRRTDQFSVSNMTLVERNEPIGRAIKYNLCEGYVLLEPARTSIKDNNSNKGKRRGFDGGGGWGSDEPTKEQSNSNGDGIILILDDPAGLFSPRANDPVDDASKQNDALVESDAIAVERTDTAPDSPLLTQHIRYTLSSLGNRYTTTEPPKRGDLVTFNKGKNGTAKDISVVTKSAAEKVNGCLSKLQLDENRAIFKCTTDHKIYNVNLSQVVGCDTKVLKEDTPVEGILVHQQEQEQEQEQDKIVGICRTADLYLKSAIFGSGGTLRERPKLNLTVKKELQNLGGKIIAQSCMAKGPDGSMGFHSGWTSRVSKFNMNETACRDELKNSDEEVHAS